MKRIRELINEVRSRDSKEFEKSCKIEPAKARAYRTYDDALCYLDNHSWDVLKSKALAHYLDHRRGQLKQGFFNQLNEAFAYRYLARRGYKCSILPEQGSKVPDIRYYDDVQWRHCEVKTIGISDKEIERWSSGKSYSNAYQQLGEAFLNKFRKVVNEAESQIRTQETQGLVFVIMLFDDFTFEHYSGYRREIESFAKNQKISNVHIKFGLRFNRHMSLN